MCEKKLRWSDGCTKVMIVARNAKSYDLRYQTRSTGTYILMAFRPLFVKDGHLVYFEEISIMGTKMSTQSSLKLDLRKQA